MSGLHFTRHALERCRERGIDPEEVITALTSCRTRVQTSDARSVTFVFRRLRRREHRHCIQGQTAQASAQKTQAGF